MNSSFIMIFNLRPVRGCTSWGWVMDVAIVAGIICFGLLTFVLLLANSNRMVWGRSGSNRTPCCKHNWNRKGGWCWVKRCFGDARCYFLCFVTCYFLRALQRREALAVIWVLVFFRRVNIRNAWSLLNIIFQHNIWN